MVSTKLDEALSARVRALEYTAPNGREQADAGLDTDAGFVRLERVKVSVRFTGELAVVEEAGLWTEFRSERVAVGTIAAGDLERVADLDNVVAIQGNRRSRPLMPATASAASAAGDDPLDPADPVHAFAPTLTGEGVVVGLVDSGIDIFHPVFRKPDGSTRITSLYDLTLRHTLVANGNPTGGTLVLSWQPPGTLPLQKTPVLSLPLTAATVQTALNAFAGIAPGDITVTEGPLPTRSVIIDFGGKYHGSTFDNAGINDIAVAAILTGGSGPSIFVRRGRTFSRDQINAALSANPPAPFASRDWNKHGTHVAGVAAGFGPPGCCSGKRTVGIAYNADLVMVRSLHSDHDDMAGVTYILDQPWRPDGTDPRPVVVNLSFGGDGTPHDGTANFEVFLDDRLAGSAKRSIVVGAGNNGGLFRPPPSATPPPVPVRFKGHGLHAMGRVPAGPTGAPVTLTFVVEVDDRVADVFNIWYPGPGRLSFDLTASPLAGGGPQPGVGQSLPAPVTPGSNVVATLGTGTTAHSVSVTSVLTDSPSGKRHISVVVNPAGNGLISQGAWTITLREIQGTETPFDCWLGLTPTDPPARFALPDRDRTRTVISPGSGRLPLTVGAYNPKDNTLADFSSRGPTVDLRLKPEVCAPGVGIVSADAGAKPPNLLVPHDGTSLAAPFVAGVVALMFEANKNLDHLTIVKHLIETCDAPVPPTPPTQLDSGWGFGRVNAEKAILAAMPTTLAREHAAAGEPLVLPSAAYPAAHVPVVTRVREVLDRLATTPTGRRVAELAATHHEEVRLRVEHDRRVLVAWRRMHGPLLLRRMLLSDLAHDEPVPRTLGGQSVGDGLARLLDELARVGSPALREAISEHRDFLLELPGARLSDLDERAGLS
ncbi:S8 family serine peptidase [Embleya sp. NPDC127516]|uniref:S8 family serine peptidase n=1 Tax=Embleya sp. NPDC127516 TaxID=3363990 RepID=UPI0037F65B32